MDENKTKDVDTEKDVEEPELAEGESDLEDDDFEYDENGDIIIRRSVEKEEKDDEESESDEEAEDGDNEPDNEEQDEEDQEQDEPEADDAGQDAPEAETEVIEPATAEPDEKDKRIAALEKKYAALEKQSKETMKKLGVKNTDDAMAALEQLAAETDEMPVDEYRRQKAEAERAEEATNFMKRTAFEQKMRDDLKEVQEAFPEAKAYKSVMDFPNIRKFGEFRDKGLSPKEAYIASHPDAVRQSVAASVKQQSLNDTKSHLKSAVPKGSKDNTVTMPKETLREWRDMFPKLSDKEIVKLYKESL